MHASSFHRMQKSVEFCTIIRAKTEKGTSLICSARWVSMTSMLCMGAMISLKSFGSVSRNPKTLLSQTLRRSRPASRTPAPRPVTASDHPSPPLRKGEAPPPLWQVGAHSIVACSAEWAWEKIVGNGTNISAGGALPVLGTRLNSLPLHGFAHVQSTERFWQSPPLIWMQKKGDGQRRPPPIGHPHSVAAGAAQTSGRSPRPGELLPLSPSRSRPPPS